MPISDINGGALSSGGRFDRIEASLLRIETKLDMKEDIATVNALDNRLHAVEAREDPIGRIFTSRMIKMEHDLELVKTTQLTGQAIADQTKAAVSGKLRLWGIIFTAVNSMAVLVQVTLILGHHIK